MEIDKNKLKETVTLSDVCDVAAAVVFVVAAVVIVKVFGLLQLQKSKGRGKKALKTIFNRNVCFNVKFVCF